MSSTQRWSGLVDEDLLLKTSPNFFNITVMDEDWTLGRRRGWADPTYYIPFKDNTETYVVYVNMVGGGVDVNVPHNSEL